MSDGCYISENHYAGLSPALPATKMCLSSKTVGYCNSLMVLNGVKVLKYFKSSAISNGFMAALKKNQEFL